LSIAHVLACSIYNQGCDGGYAYLAFKFGYEVELVPDKCMPYRSGQGKCEEKCDISKLEHTYKVTNYKYVGGSYGKCNERELMKELYENGPLVVSFVPEYPFQMYKAGIFRSKIDSWKKKGIATKPEWEKVDHSVVLTGWGYDEEKKTKFWILQNSWGDNWGENGFFKMIRGEDHCGIESIGEAGDAIQIKNKRRFFNFS